QGRGRSPYQEAGQLPARIMEFKAEPVSIKPGESTTLTWAVENPRTTTIEPTVGRATPRGVLKVTPKATTTYTLTVTGVNGTLTKTVTVNVAGTTPAAATGSLPRTPTLKPGAEKYRVVRGPDDTGLYSSCTPPGVPQTFMVPYYVQFVQAPKHLIILHEYLHLSRTITLDGSPHPPDPDP